MKLIGFVGNACTGKTTAVFGLVQYLKLQKQRVGYINDLCRSMPFSKELFDTKPEARLAVLFKQFEAEMEQSLRDDVDYIITERTVLDWYLYYKWTCQNVGSKPNEAVNYLVRDYIWNYDTLFYMDDRQIEYVPDGFRPASVDLRNEMSELYKYRWESNSFCVSELTISSDSVEARCEEVKRRFARKYLGGQS